MRVGVVPSDSPSCEYFRAGGAAEVLAAQGQIQVETLPNPCLRYEMRRGALELVGLRDVPQVDVMVFVRGVFAERIHNVMRLLRREGIAIVVDYDDLYAHLPTALADRHKIGPNVNPRYNWRHAREAAKLADVVTVSTDALRGEPGLGGALVLRNCVPQRYLDAGRRAEAGRDGRLVGWGGIAHGHPGDLRVCGAGVNQALERAGARFRNVGDGVLVQRELNLQREPEVTGFVPFAAYAERLAVLDVAIAPLQDTAFNAAKSSLKALESLACGSQVVASTTTEYRRLYEELDEWCYQAQCANPMALARARARDWQREVSVALSRTETVREVLAASARAFIAERYLLESEAWRWAEAWELAVRRAADSRRREVA